MYGSVGLEASLEVMSRDGDWLEVRVARGDRAHWQEPDRESGWILESLTVP